MLPGAGFFALGGENFGRAFASAIVSGDAGLAGLAEFAFAPRDWLPSWAAGSEAYLFLDGGQVWREGRGFSPALITELASAGGGVRVSVVEQTVIGLKPRTGSTRRRAHRRKPGVCW